MADMQKVLKGLECCILRNPDDRARCSECPYEGNCVNRLKMDALELLKEREAVTIKKTKEHVFGVYGGICPKCKNWIQSAHSYCGFCGQAVKWDE